MINKSNDKNSNTSNNSMINKSNSKNSNKNNNDSNNSDNITIMTDDQ